MLVTSQIRKQSSRSFICWQCFERFHSGRFDNTTRRPRFELTSSNPTTIKLRFQRPFNAGRASRAIGDVSSSSSPSPVFLPPESLPRKPDIRQRLREWEAENANKFVPILEPVHGSMHGVTQNTLTRPQHGDLQVAPDDADTLDDDVPSLVFDRDDLVDVGNKRAFLLTGDLVELMYVGSQQQELAIFVREFETQSQFYTMSGKWVHRASRSAQFFVPHFIDPHELDDLRPYLPTSDISSALMDKLHDIPQSLPRNIGKSLIRKMQEFWAQADAAYQAAASKLDNAHLHVADNDRFRYATLEEIAETLFSETPVKARDGKFSQPVLYAVHRSLLRDDIGFRAQKKGSLRAGGQYEINSRNEVECVSRVTTEVRRFPDDEKAAKLSPLRAFAIKARQLIDRSRSSRTFTAHGTIGPYSKKPGNGEQYRYGEVVDKFNSQDEDFIRFLESWTCLSSWGRHSSLNGIGSTILRVTERYRSVDLDQTTAWTFLQEIGVIPPWENRVAYELRLPYVGRRQLGVSGANCGYTKDKLMHLRKDWQDLPVYCIDEAAAHEIDDGISLEPTDNPDLYWVHIHTADPAAHIEPEGAIGKYAEHITENSYMPERVVTMLDQNFVHANLSLGPLRPCVTFSAKMNLDGDLLEYKITPGIVRNVLYLSPSVVKGITLGPALSEGTGIVHVVGSDVSSPSPSRLMLESNKVSDAQKRDLRLLQKIAEARQKQLGARGGMAGEFQSPSVAVSFNGASWKKRANGVSLHHRGDPTIRLLIEDAPSLWSASNVNLVSSFMLLAGEVAARWCSDRGVPIPYRITPRNPDRPDPVEFFQKTVLPNLDADGNPPVDVKAKWVRMLGQVHPSTTAGPHAIIGAEMMAKCTSPLRRYGDLLLHWQIEAALLEEARLGKSLLGNTREDFLPFTKAKIDAFLPRLDTRERLVRAGNADSNVHWKCLFLVRAWLFGEAKLPSPMTVSVTAINPDTRMASGLLDAFLVKSQFEIPEWMNIDEIQPGYKYEVELEDVNVYTRKIDVKVLRQVDDSRDTLGHSPCLPPVPLMRQ